MYFFAELILGNLMIIFSISHQFLSTNTNFLKHKKKMSKILAVTTSFLGSAGEYCFVGPKSISILFGRQFVYSFSLKDAQLTLTLIFGIMWFCKLIFLKPQEENKSFFFPLRCIFSLCSYISLEWDLKSNILPGRAILG